MHIETATNKKRKFVILSERITFNDSLTLSKTMEEYLNSKYKEIIVDLHKVEYIDSNGLGSLIRSQIMLKRNNKKIVLVGPQKCVKRIFRDFAMNNMFEIVESYDAKELLSFN